MAQIEPGTAIAETPTPAFIGSSAVAENIRRLIAQVGPSEASVLITGPSGSGKEVVAQLLHDRSARRRGPFVPINCGAIPRDLFESELFGHERGAFTGAAARRTGRFEAADTGTMFLDEIGDMPLEMQVKLLRVLEERRVERVGASQAIDVDIRIISATHQPIADAVAAGKFREDLFYRLSIFPIHLPPLAARREDIPELLSHFVRQTGDGAALRFDGPALQKLCEYDWPGNVRELRNFVERALILNAGRTVDAAQAAFLLQLGKASKIVEQNTASYTETVSGFSDGNVVALHDGSFGADAVAPGNPADMIARGNIKLKELLADIETSFIDAALKRSDHVVADAARLLGLRRTTLCEKMRKYHIAREAEMSQSA